MKLLSVIIVTYNSEKHIYDCLEAINKYNDIGDSLEIIIVDNCSNYVDELETSINNIYGDDITFIRNTKNGGYGQGNNIGIKASSAPYVLIMNPDVRLIEPIFKKCVDYMDSNINCALYGMHQIIPQIGSGRSFSLTYRKTSYVNIFIYSILRRLDIYIQDLMFIQGSCFFLRKSQFEYIGYFDENIFMYAEEDDIHDRLRDKRFSIHYDKHINYFHLHKPELLDTDKLLDFSQKDFNSKVYLSCRDGFSKKYTCDLLMVSARFNLFREYLLMIFNRHRKIYFEYLKRWIDYLSEQRLI